MASFDKGAVPGTALNLLVEQEEFLHEFMNMIRRKFELDKQYIESLRQLRASANPKWAESAVQPVVSPILDLLDKETKLRESTTIALSTTLEKLLPSHSADEPNEEGIASMTNYKELQTSYEEYLFRYQEVNTRECIASLQEWYQKPRVGKYVGHMTANEIETYVFPEVDRKYRESVIHHRQDSQRVLEFHRNHLPTYLDTQQQLVEDIKSILDLVAMEYSRLGSKLVQAFAMMTDAVSNISSSKYIAPLHVSQEREVEHPSMQPVVYRNFYTNGQASHPVFGLPLSEDDLISLSRHYIWTGDWRPLSIYSMFRFEKTAPEHNHIQCFMNREKGAPTRCYIVSSFFTIPPFIHLSAELLTRNSDRWPRNELAKSMKTISNSAKRHLKQTLALGEPRPPSLYHLSKIAAALWCHNPEAENFLIAIHLKWDSEHDYPLPDGVVRQYDSFGRSKLVWKKTGNLYHSS